MVSPVLLQPTLVLALDQRERSEQLAHLAASRVRTQRRIARATELLTALTVTARSSAEALIASARAASARVAAAMTTQATDSTRVTAQRSDLCCAV